MIAVFLGFHDRPYFQTTLITIPNEIQVVLCMLPLFNENQYNNMNILISELVYKTTLNSLYS